MGYSLYIVSCADGSLYTGIATDVARRVAQHNGITTNGQPIKGKSKGARYTSARRPVTLVYVTAFATRSEALRHEVFVKRLSRAEKQRLIASSAASGAGKR